MLQFYNNNFRVKNEEVACIKLVTLMAVMTCEIEGTKKINSKIFGKLGFDFFSFIVAIAVLPIPAIQ